MSKRYGESIDVEASDGAVEAFTWRGKRYRVSQVVCRWRESGGWWQSTDATKPWLGGEAREVVRLDASPVTNVGAPGIYEIARDLRAGTWTLSRVLD